MFLNLIFPPTCEICGKVGTYLCDKCYFKIKKYEINYISKNKEIFCMYRYKDKIRELLIDYKFNDKSYLYNFFSELLIKNKKVCKILKSCDIIIPIPLHKKRKLDRGYNQSELILRDIAKKMDLQIENNVLKKVKNIKPQSEKGYAERMNDIKGVYIVENTQKIVGKKVLIFDDVYTTGSTTGECKKELLKVGASKVVIFTLTKD